MKLTISLVGNDIDNDEDLWGNSEEDRLEQKSKTVFNQIRDFLISKGFSQIEGFNNSTTEEGETFWVEFSNDISEETLSSLKTKVNAVHEEIMTLIKEDCNKYEKYFKTRLSPEDSESLGYHGISNRFSEFGDRLSKEILLSNKDIRKIYFYLGYMPFRQGFCPKQ